MRRPDWLMYDLGYCEIKINSGKYIVNTINQVEGTEIIGNLAVKKNKKKQKKTSQSAIFLIPAFPDST
jgi:hypothetical protein